MTQKQPRPPLPESVRSAYFNHVAHTKIAKAFALVPRVVRLSLARPYGPPQDLHGRARGHYARKPKKTTPVVFFGAQAVRRQK